MGGKMNLSLLPPANSVPLAPGITYSRNPDGAWVQEGQVSSETLPARLWRWPTRFLPGVPLMSQSQLRTLVPITPFVFWGLVAWLGWRLLRSFR